MRFFAGISPAMLTTYLNNKRFHMLRINRFLLLTALLCGLAVQADQPNSDIPQWQWQGVERIAVFGDVHGAYDDLIALLEQGELVDKQLRWVGGRTHLVSLGDLLDRGPESRRVMDLLMRLQGEAGQAGGSVHVLLGNHEIMNLTGDLRYVSPEEYEAFSDDEDSMVRGAARARYQRMAQSTSLLPGTSFCIISRASFGRPLTSAPPLSGSMATTASPFLDA